MGARAYIGIVLQNVTPEDCIVEIGSDRGEGSTTFLANYAQQLGINLYTIDFSEEVYANAKVVSGATAYHMKGEDFMSEVFPSLNKKVKFAYLDNFDWIYPEIETASWLHDQVAYYKDRGVVMNNVNSMAVHLQQTILIDTYAADDCIILFDDTWYNEKEQRYDGKGGSAVPYLLAMGYVERNRSSGHVMLQKGW